MSDDTTADGTPAEETAEEPAVDEAPAAEEAPAEEAAAADVADEPAAEPAEASAEEAPDEPAADAGPADEPAAETKPTDAETAADPGIAKVFLTENGYRVVSLWSEPEEVMLRAGRHGGIVAHQLYPVGNLPEKVQRALNPLKASKKGA